MNEEYFDILDENGNKTGRTKPRSEVHRDGDWHAAVHIWIINDKKEVLLQRRCANKDSHPNMLDISCAGHLSAGDSSLEGAVRELKEELGLEVKPEDLEYIKTLKSESKYTSDFINNEFNDLYILRTDKGIENMKYQEEEISQIFFVSYEKFKEMVESRQADLLRHEEEFKILFELLEERKNKKEEKFKKIKDNVEIIITLMGVIGVFFLKLCSYLYEVGTNVYFKIDQKFININFEYNLMNVFTYIFIVVLLFVTSYFVYKKNLEEKSKKKRIWRTICFIIPNTFLLLILFNSTRTGMFFIDFIMYAIVIAWALAYIGEKIYKIINEKKEEVKQIGAKDLFFVLGICCLFLGLGYLKALSQMDFDYITMDEQQYVVLDIYNDLYYTYPCEIDEGKIIADSSIRRMFALNEVVTQKGNFTLEIK